MPFPIQSGWKRGEPLDALMTREWLVTNGLGGYASGTIGGAVTRRFHGMLIAALPAPRGRYTMLNHLEESLALPNGRRWRLTGDEHGGSAPRYPEPDFLEEFVMECGLPVWRYSKEDIRIEKRVLVAHLQNATCITYQLLEGPADVTLQLRPSLRFRHHEGRLDEPMPDSWTIDARDRDIRIDDGSGIPPLHIALFGTEARFVKDERAVDGVIYPMERSRGYDHEGSLWSPGTFEFPLVPGEDSGLFASTEESPAVHALTPASLQIAEEDRRRKLLSLVPSAAGDNFVAQLVLAADQFLIRAAARSAAGPRARPVDEQPLTVIAGYHWFTDWGRDTMVSLEGLTLVTGRHREAGNILRTFASYIRDGLIPNLFPEGEHGGLYHTADATLWFFHAVKRYIDYTDDRETLRVLLPRLVDIIDRHVRGTRFNIHVDPADGLLTQGEEGYQLTWMDAKVDDWVVTPRRGKTVELNALYYNALCILERFLGQAGELAEAGRIRGMAERTARSFNKRFWFDEGGHLYDVVDPNDSALRPNQIFAIALDYPILDRARWEAVVDVVRLELLTPAGLRSLGRSHPEYRKNYDGDPRTRDAAYHQGTVWAWLIGPFIDAWLRVHPNDRATAAGFLSGFRPHLGEGCIGTIGEVFDAEPPFPARGSAAQAWSVAEVLRCLRVLNA
jgi:predicted glycogen debranching enzyme